MAADLADPGSRGKSGGRRRGSYITGGATGLGAWPRRLPAMPCGDDAVVDGYSNGGH